MFQADERFVSLSEALESLSEHYGITLPEKRWLESDSGLLAPVSVPPYLFRGECGDYETTQAAIWRPNTYRLGDGAFLGRDDSATLQGLIPALASRFSQDDYALDAHSAIGLLQHYGVPTWIIDFTASLGIAAAFAAAEYGGSGRICVLPTQCFSRGLGVVNLTEHSWAQRPRRQRAFGVIMPEECTDLKSNAARARFGARWYEFPITEVEREFLHGKHRGLVSLQNDPSAGFIRLHITEYTEKFGKFSSVLTDWLLRRIPIAPLCLGVQGCEGSEVLVRYVSPSILGREAFDEGAEQEYSRRYWCRDYPDSSWARMGRWQWPPPVGSVVADPRTFHGVVPPRCLPDAAPPNP